ncbi:MAG TPA: VWA domain-containing protein, partial [Candidatus Angelobacter sp.]|nr:VWA domain-containing protein [Candidatus Angelobacter sp.]
MTSACAKVLGCGLIVLLAAGMKPETSTAVPSNQPTQAASAPADPAQAQNKDKDQKPAPVYESATVLKSITRLVVVDVVATDKEGAVTDLKQDDFTILEDGKEQKIRVFNFQQPHPAPRGTAVVAASKPPENVYSNVARFNASSALNILLMDALNTNLPHQAYVRDQMIRYLEKMPEGQPVAVYTLSTKLTLLQDFTDDPAVLKKVAKDIKTGVSPLLDNPAGGPDTELLPAGFADSGLVPAQMLSAMQSFEQERVAFQTDLR